MSSELALSWTARLLAFSMGLQALELWLARDAIARVYPWTVVRREYALRRSLDPWMPHLHFVQAAAALMLAVTPHGAWAAIAAALLQALRFRGSFNGGSDAMTLVVALGVAVGCTFSARVGLGYIAAQLVLSYFLAGCWKLRGADWREGSAVERLLKAPQYAAHGLRTSRALSRIVGIGVIAFECGFPLVFVHRDVALVWLVLGALFHLINARLLGLNRFLWAWLAAYPALWYWVQ